MDNYKVDDAPVLNTGLVAAAVVAGLVLGGGHYVVSAPWFDVFTRNATIFVIIYFLSVSKIKDKGAIARKRGHSYVAVFVLAEFLAIGVAGAFYEKDALNRQVSVDILGFLAAVSAVLTLFYWVANRKTAS